MKPEVDRLYTVGEGGTRNFLHPATVSGPHTRRRRAVGIFLMALLAVLPFIDIGGTPALWLDVEHRRFHVFGWHLGPTDSYLLFFLVTAIGFSLVVASALWGRIWCGYACPQTVFLEGLYRPIERFFEGSRDAQIRLDKAPWTAAKIARKAGKLGSFALLSILLGHLFVAYFVSPKVLFSLMGQGPSAEPGIFIWVVCVSALMYGNFAWFREQLCIIICPYGRLQSVLSDRDTVVIGYDQRRGEPRGKLNTGVKGDCIDCDRCVSVCPTGIDIRQGLQLECVGCAACVDACDVVMTKLQRPTGLIRYDSQRHFDGEPRRFWRPRLVLYGAFMLAGLGALTLTAHAHRPFAAALSRQPGPPFVLDGDEVRNTFLLKAENTSAEPRRFVVRVAVPQGARVVVGEGEHTLDPDTTQRFPLVLAGPRSTGPFDVTVWVDDTELRARFAAPDR